jgi:hypothetical protein
VQHANGLEVLWDMWRKDGAPAVIPALRVVRMVRPVRVCSTAPGVTAIIEERLLRLLQSGGKRRTNLDLT